jgi:hypothetical protein
MASRELQWFGRSQPQTLQGAVILCYLNAFFGLIGLLAGALPAFVLLAEAGAGLAIANERRFGYYLGVALAFIYLAFQLIGLVAFSFNFSVLLSLAFAVVLVVLLLHKESRDYERVWFH